MSLESILRRIPNYAMDVRANLEKIYLSEVSGLTQQQVYAVSLAVCYAIKHEQLLNNFRNEAKLYLEDSYFDAAKIAAVVMAQNNTFYNFVSQCESKELQTIEINLKATSLMESGIDRAEFDMCLLGISILHKCAYCANYYVRRLQGKMVTVEAIANIARITSVLKSTAEVLEIERLRNYEFIPRGENI